MENHCLNEKVQFYKIHHKVSYSSAASALLLFSLTQTFLECVSGYWKKKRKKVVQQEAAKAKEMKNLKSILLLSYETQLLPELSSRAGLSPWWAQSFLSTFSTLVPPVILTNYLHKRTVPAMLHQQICSCSLIRHLRVYMNQIRRLRPTDRIFISLGKVLL